MKTDRVLLLLAVALTASCSAAERSARPDVVGLGAPLLSGGHSTGFADSSETIVDASVLSSEPGFVAESEATLRRRALLSTRWHRTLLALVNTERAGAGLAPLCLSNKLNAAAQAHANDQAAMRTMTRFSSNGARLWQRLLRHGFRGFTWLGESVARGFTCVQGVFGHLRVATGRLRACCKQRNEVFSCHLPCRAAL